MVTATKNRLPVAPTEVSTKAKRRTFTAEYKRKVLEELDACTQLGQIGALLRREGLYSSHVTDWRQARERGELAGPKPRGPKARPPDERDRTITKLECEVRKQKVRADRAEALVELQKKLAELLSYPTAEPNGKSR